MLVRAEEPQAIDALCRSINAHLDELNRASGAPYELSVCVGVARAEEGIAMKALIEKADAALYEQKQKNGR